MASKNIDIQIFIKCVDNAAGFPGVVVYDAQTFPIASQKGTVFVNMDEEAMEWEPSEVKPHPKGQFMNDKNLTSMEEETPMETD